MSQQATPTGCNGPSITITSSSDADSISSCETFDGDVVLDTSLSGSIALDGIQTITGDVRADNVSQLIGISADRLSTIGGQFALSQLTILSSAQFDSLESVQNIEWISLPALQSVDFGAGISQVNQVSISNTGLSALTGFDMTEVASFDLTNNPVLEAATFETLTNITNSFSVSANGLSFEISFPALTSAGNLSFANASFAAPQLTEVPGTVRINTAAFLDPFVLGSLERIGQDFEVANCESLTTLSMRALTTVGGGLRFDNNTQLAFISLPNLENIGGSLQLQGDIESLELSSLSLVRGGATIEITSNNDTICNDFATAQERNIIQGRLNCTTGGQSSNDSSSTSTASDSNPGSDSGSDSIGIPNISSLSGGAIAGIVIGAIAGVAIIALLIWYFGFRRRKQPKAIARDTLHPTGPELPRGGHHEKSELAATPNQVSELHGDGEHKVPHDRAKELSADVSQVGNMSDGSRTVVAGDSDLGSPNSKATGPAELEHHMRHELKGSDVAELRSDRTL